MYKEWTLPIYISLSEFLGPDDQLYLCQNQVSNFFLLHHQYEEYKD